MAPGDAGAHEDCVGSGMIQLHEDNFDIEERIGRGSFGEVFKATTRDTRLVCVLKQVTRGSGCGWGCRCEGMGMGGVGVEEGEQARAGKEKRGVEGVSQRQWQWQR